MTVRRFPPSSNPPQTTNRLFKSSTAGWYAEWKSKRNAPAPEPTTPSPSPEAVEQESDAAQALAEWLTGGSGA
ncbi:MAG: hypothetical protein JWO38_7130 [Gemmataceae bacterium]|nr:hypothetical protein [Gemmataceae bacterium]